VLKLLVSLDDRRLLACTCAAHDAAKDRLAAPGARGMTFRPIVLEADPGRRLRWRGHLLLAGLFDGGMVPGDGRHGRERPQWAADR